MRPYTTDPVWDPHRRPDEAAIVLTAAMVHQVICSPPTVLLDYQSLAEPHLVLTVQVPAVEGELVLRHGWRPEKGLVGQEGLEELLLGAVKRANAMFELAQRSLSPDVLSRPLPNQKYSDPT